MAEQYILSCNAGSSSLKISLFTIGSARQSLELVLQSSISNINSPPASFSFQPSSDSLHISAIKNVEIESIVNHESGFSHFLNLLEEDAGIQKNRIRQVCHRVVHGGDFREPVVISPDTQHHIESLSDLAPLHNGAALDIISSCLKHLPTAQSIAFFDTSFHRSIPNHISAYAIDQKIATQRGLKKYGFHGLSYSYILREVSKYIQKPRSSVNLIILHLGSGASICAVKGGKSLDTSMGLTPLDGLPGSSRSGTIDPSLIFHYTNTAGRITHDSKHVVDLQITEAEEILNTKSGWKALTGTSNFAEITSHASEGSEVHRFALDLFVDRLLSYIGAYYLKLEGKVDALVFSGGIGERSIELRELIGKHVLCLGFSPIENDLNIESNSFSGVVCDLGRTAGDKRVLVCRTDEQFEMAHQCCDMEEFWGSE